MFNQKIVCLHVHREGDISLIESDAITNTTDETLTEKNTISNRIFQRAGPELYDEISNDNRGKQCHHTYGENLKIFVKSTFKIEIQSFYRI